MAALPSPLQCTAGRARCTPLCDLLRAFCKPGPRVLSLHCGWPSPVTLHIKPLAAWPRFVKRSWLAHALEAALHLYLQFALSRRSKPKLPGQAAGQSGTAQQALTPGVPGSQTSLDPDDGVGRERPSTFFTRISGAPNKGSRPDQDQPAQPQTQGKGSSESAVAATVPSSRPRANGTGQQPQAGQQQSWV